MGPRLLRRIERNQVCTGRTGLQGEEGPEVHHEEEVARVLGQVPNRTRETGPMGHHMHR